MLRLFPLTFAILVRTEVYRLPSANYGVRPKTFLMWEKHLKSNISLRRIFSFYDKHFWRITLTISTLEIQNLFNFFYFPYYCCLLLWRAVAQQDAVLGRAHSLWNILVHWSETVPWGWFTGTVKICFTCLTCNPACSSAHSYVRQLSVCLCFCLCVFAVEILHTSLC